jgi:hypothetical protein
MDITDALDELFGATREEFTALRDSWVKRARSEQRSDVADGLRQLRKPTVAAWLVNQVSRRHPDDLERLIRVGDALREAHHELAGDRLRALSKERNELSQTLTKHARAIAREAGHPFGDATADQVESTWTSAAADPEAAEAVRAGHLSAAPTPHAEQDWLAVAVAASPPRQDRQPAPRQDRQPAPRPKPEPRQEKPQRDLGALRDARRDLQQAERALDQARRAQDRAHRDAEAAEIATARLREQLAELEDQLAKATEEERENRATATAAGRTTATAEKAVRAAERKVARLEDES